MNQGREPDWREGPEIPEDQKVLVRKSLRKKSQSLGWNSLNDQEKEVLKDCFTNASIRSALGIGIGVTMLSAIAAFRRGRGSVPYPRSIQATSVALFTCAGAYGGAVSALPTCARSLAAIPDSPLGESVAVAVGDWNLNSMQDAYMKQLERSKNAEELERLNELAREAQLESNARSYIEDRSDNNDENQQENTSKINKSNDDNSPSNAQ